jgi:Xaa-Pro aminopeptidase
MFKAPEEVAQLREACRLTAEAFRRVCQFIAPGKMEFEVEAEIIHTFIRGRAYGHAYEPIIATGKNACTLHYNQNNCALAEGDLLLMDFGAKYAHYSADLTRTVPVSGRFTDRQRRVYDAVLRVHQDSIQRLRPGRPYQDYFEEAQRQMQDELLALGLLTQADVDAAPKDWPAFKKYFPHGLGHHLGLDTHDLGDYYMEIQPGMVFTVEPGIYINAEGLGIRIENDILVTENGPEDLMADIPVSADDIEALMRR